MTKSNHTFTELKDIESAIQGGEGKGFAGHVRGYLEASVNIYHNDLLDKREKTVEKLRNHIESLIDLGMPEEGVNQWLDNIAEIEDEIEMGEVDLDEIFSSREEAPPEISPLQKLLNEWKIPVEKLEEFVEGMGELEEKERQEYSGYINAIITLEKETNTSIEKLIEEEKAKAKIETVPGHTQEKTVKKPSKDEMELLHEYSQPGQLNMSQEKQELAKNILEDHGMRIEDTLETREGFNTQKPLIHTLNIETSVTYDGVYNPENYKAPETLDGEWSKTLSELVNKLQQQNEELQEVAQLPGELRQNNPDLWREGENDLSSSLPLRSAISNLKENETLKEIQAFNKNLVPELNVPTLEQLEIKAKASHKASVLLGEKASIEQKEAVTEFILKQGKEVPSDPVLQDMVNVALEKAKSSEKGQPFDKVLGNVYEHYYEKENIQARVMQRSIAEVGKGREEGEVLTTGGKTQIQTMVGNDSGLDIRERKLTQQQKEQEESLLVKKYVDAIANTKGFWVKILHAKQKNITLSGSETIKEVRVEEKQAEPSITTGSTITRANIQREGENSEGLPQRKQSSISLQDQLQEAAIAQFRIEKGAECPSEPVLQDMIKLAEANHGEGFFIDALKNVYSEYYQKDNLVDRIMKQANEKASENGEEFSSEVESHVREKLEERYENFAVHKDWFELSDGSKKTNGVFSQKERESTETEWVDFCLIAAEIKRGKKSVEEKQVEQPEAKEFEVQLEVKKVVSEDVPEPTTNSNLQTQVVKEIRHQHESIEKPPVDDKEKVSQQNNTVGQNDGGKQQQPNIQKDKPQQQNEPKKEAPKPEYGIYGGGIKHWVKNLGRSFKMWRDSSKDEGKQQDTIETYLKEVIEKDFRGHGYNEVAALELITKVLDEIAPENKELDSKVHSKDEGQKDRRDPNLTALRRRLQHHPEDVVPTRKALESIKSGFNSANANTKDDGNNNKNIPGKERKGEIVLN